MVHCDSPLRLVFLGDSARSSGTELVLHHFSKCMRDTYCPLYKESLREQGYSYVRLRHGALMNILESLRSLFKPDAADVAPVDSTRAQQTDVPFKPRLWGSMPSTRSETTISLKPTAPSGNAKGKNPTRQFLDQYDHIRQDPIEV